MILSVHSQKNAKRILISLISFSLSATTISLFVNDFPTIPHLECSFMLSVLKEGFVDVIILEGIENK